MTVFGAAYASAYDRLYREKNYEAECDMIQSMIREYGAKTSVKHLIDFGCGTGNHAIPLAGRGFDVTGVDLSPAMLAAAREKSVAAGLSDRVSFREGNIQTVRFVGEKYDAAIMMFAVLGYQTTDKDVRAALDTVRYHLHDGAPFIFDVWYGPAVLADPPGRRERRIDSEGGYHIRRSNGVLDKDNHLCTVQFELEEWRGGARILRTDEDHVMRFFFPDELERLAEVSGFRSVALQDFTAYEIPATVKSWNVVGVFVAS